MSTLLDIEQIMRILPHRYPMLLVDRIIESDQQKRIVGIKNLTMNEPFFQGHFPGKPVMPGVLQLEAMAQTAGILMIQLAGANTHRVPYFMSIDKAKFRKPLVPGDQMRIEIEFLTIKSKLAKFAGKVLVDGVLASEAEMMCMVADAQVTP